MYDADNRLIGARGRGPASEYEALSTRAGTWPNVSTRAVRNRYDAWGNLTARRHGLYEQHYAYDDGNRLIRARSKRSTPTTRWDAARISTTLRSRGARWRASTRRGKPAAPGEMYWFHTDLNSAPLEMTDDKGAVRWSGHYGGWIASSCGRDNP